MCLQALQCHSHCLSANACAHCCSVLLLLTQGVDLIRPGQHILIQPCPAGLPANSTSTGAGLPDPELLAVARRFQQNAAVTAALEAYRTAANTGNKAALSNALNDVWATSQGRSALLELQSSDAAFRGMMEAYGKGKCLPCA